MEIKEEEIKKAFQYVKEDIFLLNSELQHIGNEVSDLRAELGLISSFISDIKAILPENPIPTHNQENPTLQHITPTDNPPLEALKQQNTGFSTGNGGVPTDRQTDKPTHNPTHPKHRKTSRHAGY